MDAREFADRFKEVLRRGLSPAELVGSRRVSADRLKMGIYKPLELRYA